MLPELAARLDRHVRPWLVRLPPRLAVRLYSAGRRPFLSRLEAARPRPQPVPPKLATTLWGITFRSPLGNAAGMFKDGGGYELCAAQGAGWYLAGTTTGEPRPGNTRDGILQPFAPYPRSGAASNWLGLPNPGHSAVAARLARLERRPGFPIGASVAADPAMAEDLAFEGLVAGLEAYEAAGADFLELNESCPNTEDAGLSGSDLSLRLERLAEAFLSRRRRQLPVIVKVAADTPPEQLPALLDLLLDLGFDGLNLGNTSADYLRLRPDLTGREQPLYDFFTDRFGGGVSGRPLKELSRRAVEAGAVHLKARAPAREFHLIRTGGVEAATDLETSWGAASLCGWYGGYFEALSRHGHDLYRNLYGGLLRPRGPAGSRPS